MISEFTTAKIVSIEARILDESQSSGLSTELVTLLKSGNYLTFGSEGLKLNINIIDILDGTILDKILNEAQISFQTKSAEGLAPKGNSGSSKLLANPNIMTKSGEEARIFIGDNVPVKITSGSGEQRNVEIRNLEGGIELKITPYVNSDNTIDLELTTSVNNFDYSVVIDGLPKLNKREAKTKITIKNGQTIVIGGLAREEKSKSEWKIPILGDLPIIGMLFRGMKETVEQRNITIFLTAKVIELK
ncbi:MAG: type II and III secretion system protein [Fervidobacterium sp.]